MTLPHALNNLSLMSSFHHLNTVRCIIRMYYTKSFIGSGDEDNLDERADKCKLFQTNWLISCIRLCHFFCKFLVILL